VSSIAEDRDADAHSSELLPDGRSTDHSLTVAFRIKGQALYANPLVGHLKQGWGIASLNRRLLEF